MVHAVLIDKQGTASVESMIREARATSGWTRSHLQRLVNMHGLSPANARCIETMWEELSAYAHPTWAELAPALQQGEVSYRLVPGYKADAFREATRLFRRTVDCIGYLVLVQFPSGHLRGEDARLRQDVLVGAGQPDARRVRGQPRVGLSPSPLGDTDRVVEPGRRGKRARSPSRRTGGGAVKAAMGTHEECSPDTPLPSLAQAPLAQRWTRRL